MLALFLCPSVGFSLFVPNPHTLTHITHSHTSHSHLPSTHTHTYNTHTHLHTSHTHSHISHTHMHFTYRRHSLPPKPFIRDVPHVNIRCHGITSIQLIFRLPRLSPKRHSELFCPSVQSCTQLRPKNRVLWPVPSFSFPPTCSLSFIVLSFLILTFWKNVSHSDLSFCFFMITLRLDVCHGHH